MIGAPVGKAAVFRGLYLGDLVAAVPALAALRHGLPGAEISLVSLPWATALTPHLAHLVDRVIPYPGAPGLDGEGSEGEAEEFLDRMRAEGFDLAVNMHGRGPTSTRFVARFGAGRVASFVGGGYVSDLDVGVPWDAEAHESRKLLLLAEAVLGGTVPDVPADAPGLRVAEEGESHVRELLPAALCHAPLAVVHPGASVLEKRWPAEGFGRVAESLARRGYAVAVTGGVQEKGLTRRVSGAVPGVLDLGGRTDLATLVSLVARAEVLVSNDTGPAHLAYSLGTPSVTVFGPSTDVERWGPLERGRHAVLRGDPISKVPADAVLRSTEALEVAGRTREVVGL